MTHALSNVFEAAPRVESVGHLHEFFELEFIRPARETDDIVDAFLRGLWSNVHENKRTHTVRMCDRVGDRVQTAHAVANQDEPVDSDRPPKRFEVFDEGAA